jgi:single-strand DNA-binding protein
MNRIVLVGRLESTPEIRYTSTGIPVANFSLSVRRSIPNGQGRYERDIFRVVTWRKLAETCCKFLDRGRMIAVDGKLQNRIMSTPNGDRRIIVEIHADDVRFLEGARPRNEGQDGEVQDAPENQDVRDSNESQDVRDFQDSEVRSTEDRPVTVEAIAPLQERVEVAQCVPESPVEGFDLEIEGWVPEDDGTLLV